MGDNLPDYLKIEVSARSHFPARRLPALQRTTSESCCQGDYMTHEIERSAEFTFSDLPFDEAVQMVKKMPKHSYPSFLGPLTYPAYKYIPASYIVCERDMIIPPPAQREFIEFIKKESGQQVDVIALDAGHCPNASVPKDVAEAVVKTVGGA